MVAALPASARAELFGADDAAAAGAGADAPPFGPAHPEMTEVWYVEAPYEEAAATDAAWRADLDPATRRTEHRGTLGALLDLLDPPVKPVTKRLLVETASAWTAVFSQSGTGGDGTTVLGRRLQTRTLRTSFAPHAKDAHGKIESYGDVAFWLFDGPRDDLPLNQLRVVQATRDDSGWSWWLDGEAQPFEDPSRYAEKRIPRRFDRGLLNDYCRALGIHREDPAFYGPRATLVTQCVRRP